MSDRRAVVIRQAIDEWCLEELPNIVGSEWDRLAARIDGALTEAENRPCQRCGGCGQVADTDDQEPWTWWLELPLQSSAAVLIGLVKPIPCPVCKSGEAAE